MRKTERERETSYRGKRREKETYNNVMRVPEEREIATLMKETGRLERKRYKEKRERPRSRGTLYREEEEKR